MNSHRKSICSLLLLCCYGGYGRAQQSNSSVDLTTDNSKAFSQYFSIVSIPERVVGTKEMKRSGPIVVSQPLVRHGSGSIPGRASINPPQFLIDLSERSDLVAIIELTNSKSLLTDDKTFVYSNFSGLVEQVLLDRHRQVATGDHLLITGAGGTLVYDGFVVKAIDPEFAPLKVGDRYLLCLTQVPGPQAFKATAQGSFELSREGGRVIALETHPVETLSGRSASAGEFLEDVVSAISNALAEEQRVGEKK